MLLEDALLDMMQWLKRRDLDAAQLASRILDSRITAKAAVLALHSVRRITVDDDLGVSFALGECALTQSVFDMPCFSGRN